MGKLSSAVMGKLSSTVSTVMDKLLPAVTGGTKQDEFRFETNGQTDRQTDREKSALIELRFAAKN